MATSTMNIGLTKPAGTEDAMISVINGNMDKIDAAIGRNNILVTFTGISSLPQIVSNNKITANHRVVGAVLSDPRAQLSDWEYTTANGSITINGQIDGTITVQLYLSEVY